VSVEWIRRQGEKGREGRGEIEERDVEVQQQERFERVQKSRWNVWYKKVRVLEVPKYLREKGKEGRMIRGSEVQIREK